METQCTHTCRQYYGAPVSVCLDSHKSVIKLGLSLNFIVWTKGKIQTVTLSFSINTITQFTFNLLGLLVSVLLVINVSCYNKLSS